MLAPAFAMLKTLELECFIARNCWN